MKHVRTALLMLLVVALAAVGCRDEEEPGDQAEIGGSPTDQKVVEALVDNWDRDQDDRLSRQEYAQVIKEARLFALWDRNDDNNLDKREFAGGLFSMWDADDDGLLSSRQYNAYRDAWFEEETRLPDFGALDADQNGSLTRREFLQNVRIDPLFDEFDADSDERIEQNEYAEGLFIMSDRDFDGHIEQDEILF